MKKSNTQKTKVDVAVIGAGTAGLVARNAAEKEGASVLLIAQPPHGTTCARTGCMPAKLLIAAADAAHGVRQAPLFGLKTTLRVDGVKVMRRLRKERDRFVSYVLADIRQLKKSGKLIEGKARITGPKTLEVNGRSIHAKALVMATGTTAFIPPEYQHVKKSILTNETFFELRRLPRRLLIVGGGLIALETGQALARLGTQVTIIGRSGRVGPVQDPVILKTAEKIFSDEFEFYSNHELMDVRKTAKGVRVKFKDSRGRVHQGTYEKILMAAGRHPRLSGEDLCLLGLKPAKRGYPAIDPETLRAGKSGVFFAGDATGERQVLHEASHDGRAAGINAAHYPKIRRFKRPVALTVLFTDPEIAMAGKTWDALKGRKIKIGENDYESQGRATIMGVNRGKVRVYADAKTGKLLGAEMIGPRMEHMAHFLALAIERGLSAEDVAHLPYYHPTLEEGLQTALRRLARQTAKK